MTHQQRFQTVLCGEVPDRIPVVMRLDLWYKSALADGSLPPECKGLSIPQIESKLGIGRSSRFNDFHRLVKNGVETAEMRENGLVSTELKFGSKTLRQILAKSSGQEASGMEAQSVEYYLKDSSDYETMTAIWEKGEWAVNHAGLEQFIADVGKDGLAMVVLGKSPIHEIMIHYAGYENFYCHLADFPEKVEGLLRVMESRFEELWPQAAQSSAELVLHGAHWSGAMTPPPIFRKYFLPYFSRFTRVMHAAGKKCVFHADADMNGLLDLAMETGMDVADCFACAPLVPQTLKQVRDAWGDKIIIWGGIPSTILVPSCPEEQFQAYIESFADEISDGRAIIVGVSDNVMPGTSYNRISQMIQRVQAIVPGAVSSNME